MNFNLFLIILIALLIIFCIILYNGIRILLVVGKEKGIVKYEFKVTILKIPIFKRTGSEGIIDIIRRKDQKEDSEKTKEDSESKDEKPKKKIQNPKTRVLKPKKKVQNQKMKHEIKKLQSLKRKLQNQKKEKMEMNLKKRERKRKT